MKKLTRSRSNSVIFGVCGGIGDFFNIDPIILRIVWGLSLIPSFFTSSIIYIICAIIIPYGKTNFYEKDDEPDIIYEGEEEYKGNEKNNYRLIGLLLVLIGLFFLAKEFVPNFMFITRLWPILLIIAGIHVIFNKRD